MVIPLLISTQADSGVCESVGSQHLRDAAHFWVHMQDFVVFLDGSDDKESTCNAGDLGSIPGLGRSLGEGNGNPLQYSCLKNSMDRGAWRAMGSRGSQRARHTERLTHTHTQDFVQLLGGFKPHCPMEGT